MSNSDHILKTLDELDLLAPALNMAYLSRAAGKGRGTFKNWQKEGVDMTKTRTRNQTRKILIEILKEIHFESGRILRLCEDQRDSYRHLTDN